MDNLIRRQAVIEAIDYCNEWKVLGITVVDKDDVMRQINVLPTIEERKTGKRMNGPITNADRIRTMTDEELAEMFEKWITNCDCNFTPCVEYCDMFDGKTCKERWLGWLKKAVEK